MKKELTVNIFMALISISLVFLVAETILRFSWEMGGWVKRPIYQRSSNPYLRYELIPRVQSGNVSINCDGFRGPEYSIKKPAHTFRIIMLGDSEIFSIMLAQNETLATQLENLVNRMSSSVYYEVLNFGVEGYNTFQELEMLKTKGLKYDPDLIILNYVLNDPEPGEYYFEKSFFMRQSSVVRYFTYRIKKALIKKERKKLGVGTKMDNLYYYHQPKYFTHVKKAIQEMTGIAKKQTKKLVIVIFPDSSILVKDFKENYPYLPLHNLLKSIDSGDIVFIDLIDEFNRLDLKPQQVSINYIYDESHKNAAALKVAANYIYQILKSQRIIPQ